MNGCCSLSYLDPAPSLLLEQHVLRLHVAVDDLVPVEEVQALQQRVRELPHQLQREALELVLLDQLVQVDGKQFERQAGKKDEGKADNCWRFADLTTKTATAKLESGRIRMIVLCFRSIAINASAESGNEWLTHHVCDLNVKWS